MILPHGGTLVNGYASEEQAQALRDEYKDFPTLSLNSRQIADAHMIAQGAFSPLHGFMSHEDYISVVKDMRLASGHIWPLPVTLSADSHQASELKEGKKVSLVDEKGCLAGILSLEGKFRRDKEEEALKVYLTQDDQHPGVARLYDDGDVLLSGTVTMLWEHFNLAEGVSDHYQPPTEIRESISELGWDTVVGFQTVNPVHRAHEYIQKCALESVDGILLHPIILETKKSDIPIPVLMDCYQVLLDQYYPKSRVILSVLPLSIRYAGPREAVFHALVRKNYGCTHFVVGRDHASVGKYYGAYDAQSIFNNFEPDAIGIIPMFFENSFYCRKCHGMATDKTCPHKRGDRINLSTAQVRSMLAKGKRPPLEFTRSEVVDVLMRTISVR